MQINRRFFFNALAGAPFAQVPLAAPQQPPTVSFNATPSCSTCGSYLVVMRLDSEHPPFVACEHEGCAQYRRPFLLPAVVTPTKAAPKEWLDKVIARWEDAQRKENERYQRLERMFDDEHQRKLRADVLLDHRIQSLAELARQSRVIT